MKALSQTPQRLLLVMVHGSAEMYGSDKVLLNLAVALQDDAQFEPVVVLHEDGPLRTALQHAGVEVHVGGVLKISRAMLGWRSPWQLVRGAILALRDFDRIIAGRRVALVHSNTLAVMGGALWASRRGHRHLWHVHEIILKPRAMAWLLPQIVRILADRVLSNSKQTQQWLLKQAPALGPRATVVFNGLPKVELPRADAVAAFRSSLGCSDRDILVTLAGRLNHWKGQGLLVQALALLRGEPVFAALKLVFVGDVFAGQEHVRQGLRAQISALGLNSQVHLLPFVSDIYSVWCASQIAVVASTEPEPFGMVAIEAMACAVPVVAAAHGGLLDIVVDEQTGLLFEPRNARALADKLLALANNATLRQRLGNAGKIRQAQKFSFDVQASQTKTIYRELMVA